MTPAEVQEALQVMGYITIAGIIITCCLVVWDMKRRAKGGAYRRRY